MSDSCFSIRGENIKTSMFFVLFLRDQRGHGMAANPTRQALLRSLIPPHQAINPSLRRTANPSWRRRPAICRCSWTSSSEEILSRLPLDNPAILHRAALVCKPWRRLISGPTFRRRLLEFHVTTAIHLRHSRWIWCLGSNRC
jgi:hypothetical protein